MRIIHAGLIASILIAANAAFADAALDAAIAGDWRSAEDRSRDQYRHPAEALTFWGLKPGMTILEVQPGAGAWWTEILAPYAHATGGTFYATGADLDDPNLTDAARQGRSQFDARYAARPDIYGKVHVVPWGGNAKPLPANTFDFIMTARSVHGWKRAGTTDKSFAEFFNALKPGGILALEQHRNVPNPADPDAFTGYVTEAYVIEHAEQAGFRLAGRSEVNANPRDTKDHPFGIWTLPPSRATSLPGSGQAPDANFDHAKYDAIGESDRMTLRFEKPR